MQAVPSPLTSCCFYIEDGLFPKQVCYFTGPAGQESPCSVELQSS